MVDFKNQIEANYPNVECHLTGENLGYAKGNNLGLSKVKSKYALILNPDAKLEKDTLENEINDIIKDNFKIKKYFENQKVIKTIFVKNKIINYITSKQ